jgi:hypothetical protein
MGPTPEQIQHSPGYRLIARISHDNIKAFLLEQFSGGSRLAKRYMIYQTLMGAVLAGLLVYSIASFFKGSTVELEWFSLAVLISFTALVVFHELLHAAAFLVTGVRNISFGANFWRFIFYVQADREVIPRKQFRLVALTPFMVVNLITASGTLWCVWQNSPAVILWLTIMSIHSFFCAGDYGLLCLYQNHPDKEIVTFDLKHERCSYFYEKVA